MRLRLLILTLLMVFGRCLCGKHHQPHISTLMANSNGKPYEGEAIHIQCLVKSNSFDDLVVEFHRSIANYSGPSEILSSNNEILTAEPQGKSYQVEIEESSNNANIYAFKIFNIDIQQDSGVYKCLVKQKGKVIDKKETSITVKDPNEDEDYDYGDLTPWSNINDEKSTTSIWRNYKTDLKPLNVKEKPQKFSSKCGGLGEYEGKNVYCIHSNIRTLCCF